MKKKRLHRLLPIIFLLGLLLPSAAEAITPEGYFLLGKKAFRSRDCKGVFKYMSIAQQKGFNHPGIHYYRGLCSLRTGQYQKALQYLKLSAEQGFKVASSHYFAGVAALRMGEVSQAKALLSSAVREGRGTVFEKRARELLSRLSRRKGKLSWSTRVALSVEYDSNVILLPKALEDTLRVDGETMASSGSREVVNLYGSVNFAPSRFFSAGARIRYYQNVHNVGSLRDYDLSSILAEGGVTFIFHQASGLSLHVVYSYWRDLLGYEDYYQSHSVSSFMRANVAKKIALEGGYTYRFDDFYSLFRKGSPRDANVNFIFSSLRVSASPFKAFLRFYYERNNAYSDLYRFYAVGGSGFAGVKLPMGFSLEGGISAVFRNYYRHPDSRKDTVQFYSFRANKQFGRYVLVRAYYSFTKNNSAAKYDYSRHIVGVEVSAGI